MHIDRRAYCGVEALTWLAHHGCDGPCTEVEIAAWIGETPRFVGSVMADLLAAGLVTHTEVPVVGYRLACSPMAISVATIVEAVERGRGAASFNSPISADIAAPGRTDPLWQAIRGCLTPFLADIALADLLDDGAERALGKTEHVLPMAMSSRALH